MSKLVIIIDNSSWFLCKCIVWVELILIKDIIYSVLVQSQFGEYIIALEKYLVLIKFYIIL